MDPTWENHVKPTIPNPLLGPPGVFYSGIKDHSRSASGNPEDNLPVLQDLTHEIFKD